MNQSSRPACALIAATLILGLHVGELGAQTPAQDGAWDPAFALPLISIHSAVLPTGKVLLFSAEHGVPGIHGWILDPETLSLTNVPPPPPWNPDCAGHSFLPDGRLLVAGGTLSFTPVIGTPQAFLFDPFSESWVETDTMASGRWYPTLITLAGGSVLNLAGRTENAGVDNPDIERWVLNGTDNWELLGQRALPYYPLLHVLPGGDVFMAGPSAQSERYDPSSDTWTNVAVMNFPGRFEASSVLLPPTLERVLVVGGYTGSGQPTNSAEVIDLADPNPSWRSVGHMAMPRFEHNALLLPDSTVFVVGGRSDNDGTPTPVLTPEIFDPVAETWDPVAPHLVPRPYHSTAVLLPDARVLVAGADNQASGEIYSPSYLFRGVRPEILSAPAAIEYGATFTIDFDSQQTGNSAVLVRPSCVTHSNNMSQRLVPLGALGAAANGVTLTAPVTPDLAPPGFYMLFVLDDDGVPSESKMVRLITRFGDFDSDDDVDAQDRIAFEACFTGSDAGPYSPGCEPADFDDDLDVDCADFQAFQLAWTEAGGPVPLVQCGNLFTSFCLGDGGNQLGCTNCPCGNSASPGAQGGCSNLSGQSAQLIASGVPSVASDTLLIELRSANPNTFAVLLSGNLRAPSNPQSTCFGLDSGIQASQYNGLRCILQGIRRHGTRPTDANGDIGLTTNGWGPPFQPAAGIIAQAGFVAGQERQFQVIYRETPGAVCAQGLNTSQGLSVTFQP